jgi:hypothetical protein
MAVTENTYTGNGSTVLYSFTFPYLETTDIRVSLNGTVTTAYTLANATTIQFNTAPANGVAIRIYRETDDSNLQSTFYPGSAIRSSDLNDNFTQTIYIAQETANYVNDVALGTIPDNSISTQKLADQAVTNAKVATDIESSKITFLQSGAGAVSRTVETKLRDVVNAKDFGAVGDGIANDMPALQSALTYAADNSKCLYIPGGTYNLEPASAYALAVSGKSGFSIRGDGYGATVLRIKTGNTGGALSISSCSNFELSGVRLDCNQSTNSGYHGLNVTNCSNYTVRSIQIDSTGGYGIGAQGVAGGSTTTEVLFDDIRINNSGADGIDIKNNDAANKAIQVSNLFIKDPGKFSDQKPGIDIRGPANVNNVTVQFINSTSRQVGVRARPFVEPGGTDSARYTNISNVIVQNFNPALNLLHQGVVIQGEKVRVTNCSAIDCDGGGFYVSASTFDGDVSLIGCHSYGGNQGIYVEQDNTTLIGCTARLDAGATGDAYRAVTCTNIKYIACVADGGVYGFRASGGATNMLLLECDALNQSTAQFALGATGKAYLTPGWTGDIDLTEGTYIKYGTVSPIGANTLTGFMLIRDAAGGLQRVGIVS